MLTLKRYPNGVEGAHFYEKQCPKHRPDWVTSHKVTLQRKVIDFCTVGDTATLVWLANLADIELHTSLALAATQDRPTMMVFDLDPGAPAGIVECCEVGLWLQGMFEGLGLQCFAKTSGSKGLQVYVPLNSDVTYEDTKPFSKSVAELLEGEAPEKVVSRQRKDLRGGKILVDWSQNDEYKTTVNVYSTRAKDRPTVSTPVTWDELASIADPREYNLFTVPQRVEDGDPWAGIDDTAHSLEPLLRLWEELPGGELSFPPDYPKMPGEPPRVQPSRKNALNWADDGTRLDS